MKDRVKKVMFGVVAVAAMALGGSAIAGAVSTSPTQPATKVQVQNTGTEANGTADKTDKPDVNEKADAAEGSEKADAPGEDTDNVQDENGKDDANESGTESANDDGPGGHADETAGPNGGASGK